MIVKLVYLELLSTPSLQRETIYGEKEKQLLNRYSLFAAKLSGLNKKQNISKYIDKRDKIKSKLAKQGRQTALYFKHLQSSLSNDVFRRFRFK